MCIRDSAYISQLGRHVHSYYNYMYIMKRGSSLAVGHRRNLFVLGAHAVKMYSWESPNLVWEIPTEEVQRGFREQRSEACLESVDWGSGQIPMSKWPGQKYIYYSCCSNEIKLIQWEYQRYIFRVLCCANNKKIRGECGVCAFRASPVASYITI